jgi:hypothetical protein
MTLRCDSATVYLCRIRGAARTFKPILRSTIKCQYQKIGGFHGYGVSGCARRFARLQFPDIDGIAGHRFCEVSVPDNLRPAGTGHSSTYRGEHHGGNNEG